MSSPHFTDDFIVQEELPARQVLRHAWRVRYLRNIFLACLAVAVLFPVYKWSYLSPSYRQMLSSIKEQSAQVAATQLLRFLQIGEHPFTKDVSKQMPTISLERLKNDFGVEKLKLFDPKGLVVFSTDPAEIGELNQHPYFARKVAKGKIHSAVVRKGQRTMENKLVDRDVVEVYIPVIQDRAFMGAFEIYYDITEMGNELNNLLLRSNVIMLVVAIGMMIIVMVVLFKASAAMLTHSRMDDALHKAHTDMEKRVQERTMDLIQANKELQLEILERKQAVDAMQQSEIRFRMLVETIPHGMVEFNRQGVITFVNPAYAKMYGFQDKELIGRSLFDRAADDGDRRQLCEHLEFLLEQQPGPSPWFSRDLTRDGRTIETQVDWNYKRDNHGQILGLIAIISEITHRKQAEKALLDNLNFMNTMIDTIPNPVFYKDAQGYYLGCNIAYAQTLGRPKDQIMGRRLIDLAGLAFSNMAEHYHRQDLLLIENPGVQTQEEQIFLADGTLRDYILFKATFNDAEGAVAGLVGVMLDISDRKQVEKELKESKNLFDAFMEHVPGLTYMKDPQGQYLFVNNAFTQFTGKRDDLTVGLCNRQIWDIQTAQVLETNDQKVIKNQAAAIVTETVQLPDGQSRYLLTTRFPIFQDDKLFALGGVSIDITERTQAEQRRQQLELHLQQSQKMESLGTLAGGIAHDFNNILAAIIGYTEIVAADTQKDAPNYHYLVRVLEAGERARALVKQILAFSRQSEIEPKPVQIKIIVKEVLKLLRASLPATIAIEQAITTDAAVMADPVQIHQVMMNMCTNAGYAMREKGGKLKVSLDHLTLDEEFTRSHAGIKPGNFLKLAVADTGSGIAPDILGRIFDPFFTTKPKGEGTGMGLSVVHGIVTGLGGFITVDSNPGQGARFDVYLPALESQASQGFAEVGKLPVGKEKILFVDDELMQTDMLKHMLGLLGYKVETANRSPEAFTLFEKDPNAFDLVITDMIMPEMTGDVLAKQMLHIRPDLPIILCTGYSENINETQAKAMGIKSFVLKPLVMEELARLIRRVLDDPDV